MQHRSRSERKDKKEKMFFAPSHNSKSGFTIESNWHVFACQNYLKLLCILLVKMHVKLPRMTSKHSGEGASCLIWNDATQKSSASCLCASLMTRFKTEEELFLSLSPGQFLTV